MESRNEIEEDETLRGFARSACFVFRTVSGAPTRQPVDSGLFRSHRIILGIMETRRARNRRWAWQREQLGEKARMGGGQPFFTTAKQAAAAGCQGLAASVGWRSSGLCEPAHRGTRIGSGSGVKPWESTRPDVGTWASAAGGHQTTRPQPWRTATHFQEGQINRPTWFPRLHPNFLSHAQSAMSLNRSPPRSSFETLPAPSTGFSIRIGRVEPADNRM